MKRLVILVAAIFFLVSSHATTNQPKKRSVGLRCGGGDGGPKPLTLTGGQSDDIKLVPTAGGVKEFLFWEARNAVIYRNDADTLQFLPLRNFMSWPISPMGLPLSRVASSDFRFLTTEGAPWVFDAASGIWIHYSIPKHEGAITPLFWDQNRLYSVAETRDADGKSSYQFFRYRVGDAAAVATCRLSGVRLAHGHRFPLAFFYSTQKVAAGHRLTIHEFDLRRCRITTDIEFHDPLIGPVLDVHRLHAIDANLVSVDHPRSNLLWHLPIDGCNYYWIPGGKPLVMNERLPVIGAFSPQNGLNLVYLRQEKISPLLEKFPVREVEPSDVWLTNAGDRLFLSPKLDGDDARKLFHLRLGNSALQSSHP